MHSLGFTEDRRTLQGKATRTGSAAWPHLNALGLVNCPDALAITEYLCYLNPTMLSLGFTEDKMLQGKATKTGFAALTTP